MNIYESKNWEVVFVKWGQEFVGDCIISSKKESLSDLTNEEWVELGKIEKELERVCKKLFNATMFHFACMMNNAYRDNEKPHVHFHFIPRYKKEFELFGKKYKDLHFGYNFWKWENDEQSKQPDIFTKEEKYAIFEMIKKEFNLEND